MVSQSLNFETLNGAHTFHFSTSTGDFVIVLPLGLGNDDMMKLKTYVDDLFDAYMSLKSSSDYREKGQSEDE